MNLSIPASTWVCLIIIAAVFFILWYLINKWKKEDKLLEHRRIVEYFPRLGSVSLSVSEASSLKPIDLR